MTKKLLTILMLAAAFCLRAEMTLESSPGGEIVKAGQTIEFKGAGVPEGSKYELKAGGRKKEGGLYSGPVAYTPEDPEWVYFQITAPKADGEEKPQRREMGVVASPEKIRPVASAPADLDKFWAGVKKEVEKFPAKKPSLVKVRDYPASEGKHAVELYKFEIKVDGGKYGSADGVTADGYLAIPVDKKGKMPAVVTFYGAGSYGADLRDALNYAQDGAIGISMNPHAIPPDLQGEDRKRFIDEKIHAPENNYRMRGIRETPDKVYFVGMFKRCYQVLRMAMAMKEWDGKNLAVRGFSQGGAQTLVSAYLCPKVTVAAPLCPAMCDSSSELAGRRAGWPDWVRQTGTETEAANAPYFDPALMAPKIKAKLYLGMGMVDNTCTPTALYAMYNSYAGPKRMLRMQGVGHGWNKEWSETEREFILKNVGLAK